MKKNIVLFVSLLAAVAWATPEKTDVLFAKRQAENDPKKPGAILINARNEYAEGSYLMPDEKNGDACLKTLRRVLGVPPKVCSLGAVAGCGNDRGGTSEQDQAAYEELTREGDWR